MTPTAQPHGGDTAPCVHEPVFIHAQKVIVGKEEPKLTAAEEARYRRNALLSALLLLLAGVWFYRHLQAYLSQAILFGLPALVSAWQLVKTFLLKDFSGPAEEMRRSVLLRRSTSANLLFASGLVLVALACTASLFVELGTTDIEKVEVEVVDELGYPVMAPVRLTSTNRIGGRIFVPRFAFDRLSLVVKEPEDYVPKSPERLPFRPWSAHRLTFSTAFRKDEPRALAVVPSRALSHPLQSGGAILSIRKAGARPVMLPIDYETVVVGAADERRLKALFRIFDDQQFEQILRTDFEKHDVRPEKYDELLTVLRNPRYEKTFRFEEGDDLTVTISGAGLTPVPQLVKIRDVVTPVIVTATVPPVPDPEDEE